MQLTESSLLEAVHERMVAKGFAPLSTVITDMSEVRNHVTASAARYTSMFFWVPGRAIIVQLVFEESANQPVSCVTIPRQCWSLWVYQQKKPLAQILRDLGSTGRTNSKVTILPGLKDPVGFKHVWEQSRTDHGKLVIYQRYESDDTINILDAVSLSRSVYEFIEQLRQTSDRFPFTTLQVTTFPPTHAFPGCEAGFWEKFDKRNLRHAIQKPWGSRGLRR